MDIAIIYLVFLKYHLHKIYALQDVLSEPFEDILARQIIK